MQSVCIIGYTLFPLVIAALLSAVGLPPIPRIPIYSVLVIWAMAAGVSILGGSGSCGLFLSSSRFGGSSGSCLSTSTLGACY